VTDVVGPVLTALTNMLVLLALQQVSDFMADAGGSMLTDFIYTLVLLA